MDNSSVSKRSVVFGLSLALTAVINAIIVVIKEKSEVVMAGMKQVTGHHWITHSLLVLVLFVVFAWLFGRANAGRGPSISVGGLIRTLVSGVAVAAMIITGFYLFID